MSDPRLRVSPFRRADTPARIADLQVPDFGADVRRTTQACTPQELYRALLEPEEHVHFFRPAFDFAAGALCRENLPVPPAVDDPSSFAAALVATARPDIDAGAVRGYASSWPVRVVREFAPTGLADGVWLQGLTAIGLVENEVGMSALRQLMQRCGDPGSGESYAARYDVLLKSVGIPPASIARWELAEMSPCAAISYEHALIGLSLALFPSALLPETVGFNLWMAAIGPCPLLEQLVPRLKGAGASTSYFDRHDRATMAALACSMVQQLLEADGSAQMRGRVARGFFAAHRSYLRWSLAVCGANVPMTPRDCVVDIVGRKARYAAGHHRGIRVGGCPLERYFAGTGADHEALITALSTSKWVNAGAPDESPLVTSVLSIDGPMFEIFTDGEQRDLREWIAQLGTLDDVLSARPVVPLEGVYTSPQDPDDLRRHAVEQYGSLSDRELLFRLVNADRFPPVRVFARDFASRTLAGVREAFQTDSRLHSANHPSYSEQVVGEMVAANHVRNVAMQRRPAPSDTLKPTIGALLDGSWLQGFANVLKVGLEEYGWLFRIYASELGDGHLPWNHNYIARRMHSPRVPGVMRPATDRRLYDEVSIGVVQLVNVSMALNTAHFLPELLGLNLSIEARGVCGSYVTTWKRNASKGDDWAALYYRLHNSIDNYASGHTKWSLSAVQAYMSRVRDAAPQAVDEQWRRIWEFWRFAELQQHGTPSELSALFEDLGAMAHESFAPVL